MKYKCFNCGKAFAKQYEMLLHYDFHKGEPVIRETGCICGAGYDIRAGKCFDCGYIHSTGWVVSNA